MDRTLIFFLFIWRWATQKQCDQLARPKKEMLERTIAQNFKSSEELYYTFNTRVDIFHPLHCSESETPVVIMLIFSVKCFRGGQGITRVALFPTRNRRNVTCSGDLDQLTKRQPKKKKKLFKKSADYLSNLFFFFFVAKTKKKKLPSGYGRGMLDKSLASKFCNA